MLWVPQAREIRAGESRTSGNSEAALSTIEQLTPATPETDRNAGTGSMESESIMSSIECRVVRASFDAALCRAASSVAVASVLLAVCIGFTACGSGGYPGAGIVELSSSAVTIDAGQSFLITAKLSGAAQMTWSLQGIDCSGAACGSLTSSGTNATYAAPATLTNSINLTAVAVVPGTANTKSVNIHVNPAPVISAIVPNGIVGTTYAGSLVGSKGTPSLKPIGITSGNLPAGLSFDPASGQITGSPTATGTYNFVAQLTDSSDVPYTTSSQQTLTVSASTSNPTLSLSANPRSGTVGTPYTTSLSASGGVGAYTFSITAGTLPPGLTLSPSTGVISGTPTAQGSATVTARVQDSATTTASTVLTITIAAAPVPVSLTVSSLPAGTVGTPYSSTIGVTGGTSPYSCSITSGSLPAGLSLSSACVVSGTPTSAGTATVTIKATDGSSPSQTGSGMVTLTIAPVPLVLATGALPNGRVGISYSATIGVTGGTSLYSCTITSGALPAGLGLGAGCSVTGTPTAAGTATFTVTATDSATPAQVTTGSLSITILPAFLTVSSGTLPGGTVGASYSTSIPVSGGTSPYSCVVSSGSLPAGLTLGAGCSVSGTPTAAGTFSIGVTATDSGAPAQTASGAESITIAPAPVILILSSPPTASVGTPYSGTIGVTGGTGPYSCTITSGSLPAGLSLGVGCAISGTPTTSGTAILTVSATDSGSPTASTSGQVTLQVSPAALVVSAGSLPNGTVGTPYAASIPISGGTSPYSCTLVSGAFPAGLNLTSNCTVSGTPTVAGTAQATIKVTDSGSPAQTASPLESITIDAAPATLVISNPPAGTVNVPYSASIPVTGGTGPYTCNISGGSLPAGLSLGSNCNISGTPTASGAFVMTVAATDSSSPQASNSSQITLTINAASSTLTLNNPPDATVGIAYSGAIGVSGGTAPYSCSITTGTLPAGLSLGAACSISGTPTIAGPATVTVHATDSATGSVTGPVTLQVNPISPLTLSGSLPNATLGVAYTQTLTASGGIGPYTYAVTAGSLPAGLTLSSSGVISGTPTAVGASSFTVTATDSEGTPQTASLPLVLLVVYPSTSNDAVLSGPYAFLFQGYDDVLSGVLAYQTASVGSFTADGTGVISNGELDSNHQTSVASGNTISTNEFIGTYTIGSDLRGTITITQFKSDGTTGTTSTFAIALKVPVSPASTTSQGDLIEFDGNSAQGTKGSGVLAAQTTSAFTSSLSGSYAFGISGDTPCLPSCTVGIVAGPAAAVGTFTANGSGSLTSGLTDLNIASTSFSSEAITGSYGAADSNGRVALTMSASGLPSPYPTDYAAYIVDVDHLFILSTDKHSSYILLVGTGQKQSQATFSNSSLSGAYVGYENSPTNPGLVGATLTDTLGYSTATLFRGTGSGSGTCTTTNVDQAGLTALINGMTGIGSGSSILNALFGTYASTGTSSCTITSEGRGVLAYPAPSGLLATTLALLGLSTNPPSPRVFYLVAPNQGYFLETGYAGLGQFEPQTGAPFSLSSLNGTFVYGLAPASSLVSINSSGIFVADGAGNATSTLDENLGLGTINVLQAGVTGSYTYALQSSTAGRYTAGTLVIYAISPSRYVLVDENATTTSPSVAILY